MTKPFETLLALAERTLVAIRVVASPDVRPEAARIILDEQIHALSSAAERQRLPIRDVDDVVYALAAHADEVMLARHATREAWLSRLLQLALFGENAAGEGFFTRLDAIRRDASRGHVLLVYYVVLALGFRGRYATEDAARLELLENVHLDLIRSGATTDPALSPHAIPVRRRLGGAIDPRWALAFGAGACVLGAAAWALFALDLWMHTASSLGG